MPTGPFWTDFLNCLMIPLHRKPTSSAPVTIDYGRPRPGDVVEIVGDGAPGYAAVGDRVRVVHVGLDYIVVEDKSGRWAKFIGNQGASRLRVAETDVLNSSDRPPKAHMRRARVLERVSIVGVDAELLQEVDSVPVGPAVAQAMSDHCSPVVIPAQSKVVGAQTVQAIEMVG